MYRFAANVASKARVVKNSTQFQQIGCPDRCVVDLTGSIGSGLTESIKAGMSEIYLRRGIEMAVNSVVTNLESRARTISTSEEIAQVAAIAAYVKSAKREIGELIAKAIEKVGKRGVIIVQDGKTLFHKLEFVEGVKLGWGYNYQILRIDQLGKECELDDPLILIHEKEITSENGIKQVLEFALKRQRPLLVIAEDVYHHAHDLLVRTNISGEIKVCVVKASSFDKNMKANLQDLATLTGGQVITEELGLNIENVDFEMLGTCKKVTISENEDIVILDGAGEKQSIEERCEQIRSAIELSTSDQIRSSFELSTSDWDKKMLQKRLAMLSGVVAVIKIGGASEGDVSAMKCTVRNALNATKMALEEGVVPGGVFALLRASEELHKLPTLNSDHKTGVQIIQNAIKKEARKIASRAGAEGDVVVDKLLEQDNPDLGYDADTGEFVDMVKAGIFYPLKYIRRLLPAGQY